MRLLDRLDAIDRRLGLAPRSRPNRITRWVGAHPLRFSLVYAAVIAGAFLPGVLLTDVSVTLAAIQVGFGFALGIVLGFKARNECEAWDRHVKEES